MAKFSEHFWLALIALALALFVRFFVLTAYRVPSTSMAPGLKPGDFIFALRTAYSLSLPGGWELWSSTPKRGDIVVFRYPDEPGTIYAKRVIGVPGDHILVDKGRITLNDHKLEYESAPPELIQDLPGKDFLNVFWERSPDETQHAVVFNAEPAPGKESPFIVPPDQVFLIGDNRDASDDSRDRGPVPISSIEGRVVFIWLSLNYHQKWLQNRLPSLRWDRTLSFVD